MPKIGRLGTAVASFLLGMAISAYGIHVFTWLLHGKPAESMNELDHGPFKVLIRSQEFHHSGIVNVDICVAEISSRAFPRGKGRCFLHGFDFTKLSVQWKSEKEIEVTFGSGRLTQFTNSATAYDPKTSLPVEFHISLQEEHDD